MCFSSRRTHFTWVTCIFRVEEHISLGICFFKKGETQFTRDVCFLKAGKHILLGICVFWVVELILLGIGVSYVAKHISQVRFVD